MLNLIRNLISILIVIIRVFYFIIKPFGRFGFILSAISHFYRPRDRKVGILFQNKKEVFAKNHNAKNSFLHNQ